MQPPGLPPRVLIRLPCDARHVNPQSASHGTDQCRAGRRSAHSTLARGCTTHAHAARVHVPSTRASCGSPQSGHQSDPRQPSTPHQRTFKRFEISRQYTAPCCSVATATCNRKTPWARNTTRYNGYCRSHRGRFRRSLGCLAQRYRPLVGRAHQRAHIRPAQRRMCSVYPGRQPGRTRRTHPRARPPQLRRAGHSPVITSLDAVRNNHPWPPT